MIRSIDARPSRPLSKWVVFVCVLAFWMAYWHFDLPLPFYDDVAFAGAAVRFATGHGFDNPWLRHWYEVNPFFIYPPAYFYVLAGWLKLFGVSAAAIQTFYAILGLFITLTFGAFFRSALSCGVWIFCALCLIVVTSITYDGFRPDTLGLAFLGSGLFIGISFRGGWAVFFATLCLAFTIMTAPSLATYAAGLGLWTFWTHFLKRLDTHERIAACLPVLFAAGVSVVAFFLMIDFRLTEFLRAFGANAEARRIFWPPKNLLEMHALAGLVLIALNGIFLFIPPANRKARELSVVVSLCLLASFFVHVHDIAFNFFLFSGLLLIGMAAMDRTPWKELFFTAYLMGLLFFNGPLVEFLYLRRPLETASYEKTRALLAGLSASGKTVIFDSGSLRYFFNENPPPEYVDLTYSRRPDPAIEGRDLASLPHDAGTIWIVSCYTLALRAYPDTLGMKSVPTAWPISRILSPKRRQFPLQNWAMAVIRFDLGESFPGKCALPDRK